MATQRKSGFTLIELMIVVAVIAILAAIAVPWWGRYTYRARRTDGQKLLLHVAQAEARYYTDYNAFPTAATSLGYSTDNPVSDHGYYKLSLGPSPAASAGQGFVAKAVPQGVQAKDDCGDLSIDNTGEKKPLPTNARKNRNGSCW